MERSVFENSGGTLHKHIILGNTYKPPKNLISNYRIFKEQLVPVFEHLQIINCEAVIAGDTLALPFLPDFPNVRDLIWHSIQCYI